MQGCLQLFGGYLLAFEVTQGQVVVALNDEFDHLLAVGAHLVNHVSWDVSGLHRRAELVCIYVGVVLDEVHYTLETRLDANGDLYGHRMGPQALDYHLDAVPEGRARAVHLVYKTNARHVVAVSLAPDRLRLRLDARYAVEYHDAAVEHAQRALDLDREVYVARCIYDIDAVVLPLGCGSGGGDGDATLALLLHPVHGSRTLMHFTDLVNTSGVVQNTLGSGGLPRVNVGNNAYVPGLFQRKRSGHCIPPFWILDFRFWIRKSIQNLKSKIQNP